MSERSVVTRLRAETSQYKRDMLAAAVLTRAVAKAMDEIDEQPGRRGASGMDDLLRSSRGADRSINQLTGRLRVMADVAAVLGPTLAPLSTVAVAGVGGLANQLGVAALAGGSAIIAFQGVGDALKAVNQAALAPTRENLAKARLEMEQLSPAARGAVRSLQDLRPVLSGIRDAGAQGLFPGVMKGLDALEARAPEIERIVYQLNRAMGRLMKQGGRALAGSDWDDFFDFLATDAKATLMDLGHTVGNFTRGLAELWMAFDPLSDDFSGWLLDVSKDFAGWADSLAATDGFAEFVEYVRTSGPQVASAFSAIGNALLQIAEAAAPVGGPVLAGLEAVAKVVAAIADSDLGTPIMAGVAALAVLNRTISATVAVSRGLSASPLFGSMSGVKNLTGGVAALQGAAAAGGIRGVANEVRRATPTLGQFGTVMYRAGQSAQYASKETMAARSAVRGFGAQIGPPAAALAGLAVASTGAADSMGLTNTASLALMGTMAGPWGAAIGGAVGFAMDLASANDDLMDSFDSLQRAIANAGDAPTESVLAQLDAQAQAADEKLQKLKATLDDPDWLYSASDVMTASKNKVEGWFGDSDFEEASAKSRAATEALEKLKQAQAAVANSGVEVWRRQNEALQANIDLMAEQRRELLAGNDAETAYATAVLDAKDAIKENGKTLDLSTRAGIDNKRHLDGLAATWNNLNATTEQTPEAYRAARQSLIQAATQMGMTRREARAYANELLGIPKSVLTRADVKTEEAYRRVLLLREAMAQIKDKTVTVRINSSGGVSHGNTGFGPQDKATGGPIRGPGSGTSDDVPIWASNGEFMMRTAAVDFYGERYMHDINTMRAPKFAAGGQIGTSTAKGNSKSRLLIQASTGDFVIPNLLAEFEKLAAKIKKSREALSKETAVRDQLQSAFDTMASSISDRYKSDLFGGDGGNAFTNPQADPLAILRGDKAELKAFQKAQQQLTAKGLDGKALDELLSRGNLDEVQAMASWSKAQVAEYERLYAEREKLALDTGRGSANAAYGDALRESRAEVREQTKHLKQIERRLNEIKNQGKGRDDRVAGKAARTVVRQAIEGRRNARVD